MKIKEDLLPLYHGGVCSQESNVLVEEHLKECENCKNLLSIMEDEIVPMVSTIDDDIPIKFIRDKWTRSKKKAFFKGIVIAIVICAILFGAYYGLTSWKCILVAADLLEVTEISQLADGRIVYHINVKHNKIYISLSLQLTKAAHII